MVSHLLHPFLPYRSFIFPFLALSAIVLPCWGAVRVYRRRTRRPRVSVFRELVLLTFVVYLCGLAAATLTPNRSSRLIAEGRGGVELQPDLASLTCSLASPTSGPSARGFCGHNARGNVMLFFPLGILLPLLARNVGLSRGVQIATALSVGIELAQYLSSGWGSYRAADVNDVILNVAGASLGLVVVILLRSSQGGPPAIARA